MILKYKLPTSYGWHDLKVPEDGQGLTIEVQSNTPVLYVSGNPDELQTMRLYCAYTGMDMPEDAEEYLGTAVLDDGRFVTHYFI